MQVRQFIALASAQTASVTHQAAAGTGAAVNRLASGRQRTAILAATPVGSHGAHRVVPLDDIHRSRRVDAAADGVHFLWAANAGHGARGRDAGGDHDARHNRGRHG
jgi:hypothetical protein